MIYNGNGIPKDDIQAYAWFYLAKSNGANEAADALNDISRDLTIGQLTEAKELAAQFIAEYPAKEN